MVAAPVLWNSLPVPLWPARNMTLFKCLVKTYLFSKVKDSKNNVFFVGLFGKGTSAMSTERPRLSTDRDAGNNLTENAQLLNVLNNGKYDPCLQKVIQPDVITFFEDSTACLVLHNLKYSLTADNYY